ncbi:hypothetical protein POM88_007600 [Heracleum sosnowskyi]|uniref:Uncharacterized protein n=1 Tax=Heracleum sosnowskyi TaxID=360622 RepID=A0AAD8J891_9APIA|nr:hypothetical protein POM88_007600 [Heracleum sosnowskyi]
MRLHLDHKDIYSGRTIGNKGGVGLRLRVYDRIMCFMNCHFATHLSSGFPWIIIRTEASRVVGPVQVADLDTMEQLVEGVPQTWWFEDNHDKEALPKTDSSKGSGSRKYGSTHQGSGIKQRGSQTDNDENKRIN